MNNTMEDTVHSVVADFMSKGVLFTVLDISNVVKQTMPHAKHRDTREVVRNMFSTDIETQGWARTPITVNLEDGTTAEALLYHPLTDSWDLDNKYSAQQRAATSFRPMATAQATVVAAAQVQMTTSSTPVPAPVAATASAPVSARTLWDQMFQSATSLFPKS